MCVSCLSVCVCAVCVTIIAVVVGGVFSAFDFCVSVYDQRILEFDWSAISSPSFDAVCDLWNICWWLAINLSRLRSVEMCYGLRSANLGI